MAAVRVPTGLVGGVVPAGKAPSWPRRRVSVLCVVLAILLCSAPASLGAALQPQPRTHPAGEDDPLGASTTGGGDDQGATLHPTWPRYLLNGPFTHRMLADDPEVYLLADYVGQWLVQVPADEVATLQGRGGTLTPLEEVDHGVIGRIHWQGTAEPPELLSLVAVDGDPYLIIHLIGPAAPGWMEQVQARGASLTHVTFGPMTMVVRAPQAIQPDIIALPFVDWTAPFVPSLKERPGPLDRASVIGYTLVFFADEPAAFSSGLSQLQPRGATLKDIERSTAWWRAARVQMPSSLVPYALSLPGLQWLEPFGPTQGRMDQVRWVVQSNIPGDNGTVLWAHGLHGEGIVVGDADTGIDYDHACFSQNDTTVGTFGPSHRKIVSYNTSLDDYDDQGHGTGTAGLMVCDQPPTLGDYDLRDGLALGAKVTFYDIVYPSGVYDPPIMTEILQDALDHGAQTHSDSWGDDSEEYTIRAEQIDQFQLDHPQFLTFIAPGNTFGSPVLEPATGKNLVGVAATGNGATDSLASFNARGPTKEGVFQPIIAAPGQNVYGPAGDGQNSTFNSGFDQKFGTSFSTPVAAAASALVQQYFADGFYPSGSATPADGWDPSGPLKKAILATSGVDQYPGPNSDNPIIGTRQGWGKINLNTTLTFGGAERQLVVVDGYRSSTANGLSQGASVDLAVVADAGSPLEVSLAYNDLPGAGLMNDLDLSVITPNGTLLLGNVYSGGHSVSGGNADHANPLESVLVDAPETGIYTIRVVATALNPMTSAQPYALVVAGDLRPTKTGTLFLDRPVYGPTSLVTIHLVDGDLVNESVASLQLTSATEPTPLVVGASGIDGSASFTAVVGLTDVPASPSDGMLSVVDGDQITVTYLDAEVDGGGSGVATASALIDGAPPNLLGISFVDITDRTVSVRLQSDEAAVGEVLVGTAPPLLPLGSWQVPTVAPIIDLSNLTPGTTYDVAITLSDAWGNTQTDDNGSAFYHFTTFSHVLRAPVRSAGWAAVGASVNHLDDAFVWVGSDATARRIGLVQFDLSGLDDTSVVLAGELRLFGRDDSALNRTGAGTWQVQLLDRSIDAAFDGTLVTPTADEILATNVSESLAPLQPIQLQPGTWTALTLGPTSRSQLQGALVGDDLLSFCIRGPDNGTDLFAWDSGNGAAPGSLGPTVAPTLVLQLRTAPRLSPNAVLNVSLPEDTLAIAHLSDIFLSTGNVTYYLGDDAAAATADRFVVDGLEATLDQTTGVVRLLPDPDWNGAIDLPVAIVDAEDNNASAILQVIVTPVNDAPRIVAINDLDAREGIRVVATEHLRLVLNLTVADVDLPEATAEELAERLHLSTNRTDRMLEEGPFATSLLPTTGDLLNESLGLQLILTDGLAFSLLNLTIDIENLEEDPVAQIAAPLPNATFTPAEEVNFSGVGSADPDEVVGDLLRYEWSSSIDGLLGTNETIRTRLSVGNHSITLTVTDVTGRRDSVSVPLRVCCATSPDPDPENPTTPLRHDPPGGAAFGIAALWWVVAVLVISAVAVAGMLRRTARLRQEAATSAGRRPRRARGLDDEE